jgi:hypothetical protein
MIESRLLLVGCGILKKEIKALIEKNGWPLDALFLDSSLHVDFEKLEASLTSALEKHREREIIVFYGCCHPRMDKILERAGVFRTTGQNCVDMLLGNERFSADLQDGAFFLFEEWAKRWEPVMGKTFGGNMEVLRLVFQGDRKYLLCVQTPSSGDFKAEAEEAGRLVGLPVRSTEVSLDRLEAVLKTAIARKRQEIACRS